MPGKHDQAERRRMLAFLRDERACLRDSYREVDGVVRDRRVLRDMETIDRLTVLVRSALAHRPVSKRSKTRRGQVDG